MKSASPAVRLAEGNVNFEVSMWSILKGRAGAFIASSCVLVAAGGFVAYGLGLLAGPDRHMTSYHATFSSTNGLDNGADVDLGGVTVGRVRAITLNPETAVVDVLFSVQDDLKLPVDTAVAIAAPTIGGDNALQLLPGRSGRMLTAGATILDAHPLLSLEQQISNYIFGAGKL